MEIDLCITEHRHWDVFICQFVSGDCDILMDDRMDLVNHILKDHFKVDLQWNLKYETEELCKATPNGNTGKDRKVQQANIHPPDGIDIKAEEGKKIKKEGDLKKRLDFTSTLDRYIRDESEKKICHTVESIAQHAALEQKDLPLLKKPSFLRTLTKEKSHRPIVVQATDEKAEIDISETKTRIKLPTVLSTTAWNLARRGLPRLNKLTGEIGIFCNFCPMFSKNLREVALHIDSTHISRTPRSCRICNVRFISPKKLENHMTLEHEIRFASDGNGGYECCDCSLRFGLVQDVIDHDCKSRRSTATQLINLDKEINTLSSSENVGQYAQSFFHLANVTRKQNDLKTRRRTLIKSSPFRDKVQAESVLDHVKNDSKVRINTDTPVLLKRPAEDGIKSSTKDEISTKKKMIGSYSCENCKAVLQKSELRSHTKSLCGNVLHSQGKEYTVGKYVKESHLNHHKRGKCDEKLDINTSQNRNPGAVTTTGKGFEILPTIDRADLKRSSTTSSCRLGVSEEFNGKYISNKQFPIYCQN